MKRSALCLALMSVTPALFAANIAISTTTNSRNFPLPESEPLVVSLTKDNYVLKITEVDGNCSAPVNQKVRFNNPLPLNCGLPTELPINIRFSGDYAFVYNAEAKTILVKREPRKTAKVFKRPLPDVNCQKYQGGEITLTLDGTYSDGTELRDAYSGTVVTVLDNKISITPSVHSGGIVLLEPVEQPEQSEGLYWRNANIYFVMVDRFYNADKSNDNSYGREKDGKDEIGTFHGGDLQGVTEKLDYIQSLGTDAIWLSPVLEQIHGFVGGGEKGSFPFYSYHGYWTRDFTKIDENFGQDDDLRMLIEEAHKRGIKILMDAVLNHSGYSSLADLQFDGIEVVAPTSGWPEKWAEWKPAPGENWHSYHSQIEYSSPNWLHWWGPDWVRTGLPGYPSPGSSDTKLSLAGLPDFLTESEKHVTPPEWLLNNPGTGVRIRDNYTVSDYLIEWQTDWVRRFGIDGYRVDTVKHVEGNVWKRLKSEASVALEQWRNKKGKQGQPFFMMGEVWGHTAYRSPYFDDGFDALINFDLQKKMDRGAACLSEMNSTYESYARTMQEQADFNPVSYMSSHDTELFFSRFKSFDMQRGAASALLLSPGAVQVYYGDEVGRNIGPYADDFHQGTRSDMVWKLDDDQESLLQHWKKIGQFRQSHPSVGGGKHKVIEQDSAYVFSRTLGKDKVIVAFAGK